MMDYRNSYQQQAPYVQQANQIPQQYAPMPIQPPVKPKKGWGKLIAAFACLPLLIVAEIAGLYLGDATPLGEDVGATLGGAIAAVILCCILGGTQLLNITGSSWKWAWRAMWWSIAISGAIALIDLFDYISADNLIFVRDWPWQLFLSLLFCVAIGFFEEGMVRGLILNGLLSRMGTTRKGIVWACIISSLVFGLLHVDITRIGEVTALEFAQGFLKVVQTGMYGFALAAVICKTGELTSAALLHCLDDWLLFVLTFIMGGPIETEYVSSGTEEGTIMAVIYLVCIVLYIPLVVRAAHTLKDIDVPNRGAFFRERRGVASGQAAPLPPAGYVVAVPQGYAYPPQMPQQPPVQQAYPQPQYAAQQAYPPQGRAQPTGAPMPPAGFIPAQIPEADAYRMDQSGARRMQTPPDRQIPR